MTATPTGCYMREIGREGTIYMVYTAKSDLSDFAMFSFTVNGKHFAHQFQYSIYDRAEFAGDDHTMQEVLRTTDGQRLTQLGHEVRDFDFRAYINVRSANLERGLYAKYTSHPELKATLLSTLPLPLVALQPKDRPTNSYWTYRIDPDGELVGDGYGCQRLQNVRARLAREDNFWQPHGPAAITYGNKNTGGDTEGGASQRFAQHHGTFSQGDRTLQRAGGGQANAGGASSWNHSVGGSSYSAGAAMQTGGGQSALHQSFGDSVGASGGGRSAPADNKRKAHSISYGNQTSGAQAPKLARMQSQNVDVSSDDGNNLDDAEPTEAELDAHDNNDHSGSSDKAVQASWARVLRHREVQRELQRKVNRQVQKQVDTTNGPFGLARGNYGYNGSNRYKEEGTKNTGGTKNGGGGEQKRKIAQVAALQSINDNADGENNEPLTPVNYSHDDQSSQPR